MLWYEGIRKEHKAKDPNKFSIRVSERQQRQASDDMRKYRAKKRNAYIAECMPQKPGDEIIIERYGKGEHLTEIAKLPEFKGLYGYNLSARLKACHARGLSVKDMNRNGVEDEPRTGKRNYVRHNRPRNTD